MDAINFPSMPITPSLAGMHSTACARELMDPHEVLPGMAPAQRFQMQSFFVCVQTDMGWMRDPFQGCPYPTQPYGNTGNYPGQGLGQGFFPGMPPMGCDPMMGGYWQGVQGMLSMQIAMLDRMIALAMMLMQMQQQGMMPQQPYPNKPPVCECHPDYPEDPYPISPEPPEPADPQPVDPQPVDPQPVDPRPGSRTEKLEQFRNRLLQASPVTRQQVLELATRTGLGEQEGNHLLTFLSLGGSPDSFNFGEPKMRALLDIFTTAAGANGDVRVVARALQQYSEKVNDLLPEGCFDALLAVAGKPPGRPVPGAAQLKEQLTEANGWGMGWTGRGCNMQDDDVKRVLASWANRADQPGTDPVAPVDPAPRTPEQQRAQSLERFSTALSTAGQSVAAGRILQIARDSGLSEQDGEHFITFLAASTREGRDANFDFTQPLVRDLVGIYVQAGQANGDLRVIAQALLQYSAKCDNRLTEEAFAALLFAGGKPPGTAVPGADQLKENMGQQDSWTRLLGRNGVDMQDDGVKRVLEAAANRSTPVEEAPAEVAPVEETPEARSRRERNANIDRFADELLNAGNEVNQEKMVEISRRSGLGDFEGNNLWQFLATIGPSGVFSSYYDMTNPEVVEYVRIYQEAAKSGNVRGLAGALRRYANSETVNGRALNEESFDALAKAAGNPPGTPPQGTSDLKRQLAPSRSDWGGIFDAGIYLTDDNRRQVLDNFARS
jgi:hypothetical protein